MVQINLPKNSETKKGNYYKDKTGSKNIRIVNVYRWDPSLGGYPIIETYEFDMYKCPSKVLLLLNKNAILDKFFVIKLVVSRKIFKFVGRLLLVVLHLLCIKDDSPLYDAL